MEKTAEMTIAYYISSPTWGGGEQYVFDLAGAMKASGKVTPIFLFPADSDKEMIQCFSGIGACPTFPYASKLFRFSLFASWHLAKILERNHADILHINSRFSYFQAAMAKRMCRRPVRLVAGQHLVRKATDNALWRWAYRQIDTLVCVSRLVRDTYIPARLESAFKHIEVIHNSVRVAQNDCIAPDYAAPRIIYHGRICEEKGVIGLLRALERITDLPWQLDIAGAVAPEYKAQWEKALTVCPVRDRIHLLGFRSDIRQLLPNYSIGVLPSVVPEAFSLTTLENMAYGLATVNTNNGAVPEFIQHDRNGLLVPPDDTNALSAALRSLISNPEQRQRLGEQARKDFQELHNYERFMDKMNTIYGL